ncbi:MAG TPA: cupin domain-containing protein [Acidobacteriaceae bacterium]|jgi:mannose-6-phosphate isomerase-like protein (cupin superfamily)|nr:cupin domain-containing protein [Acidobacteriaceae bacterium]
MEYHLTVAQAYESLQGAGTEQAGSEQAGSEQAGSEPSGELLQLGSLTVRFYAPRVVDRQKPHTRDEVYVVARGAASFRCCGKEIRVEQGDVLTVPAGQEHVFVQITSDFATWVFFYGPEGGEQSAASFDSCCADPADTVTVIRPAAPGVARS